MQTVHARRGGARRGRVTAAVGVLAAILPALLLALAAPAAAHSRLVATTPAADSVLPTAPGEITLNFNESVSSRYTHIAVTRTDGTSVVIGTTVVAGATVRQPLAALADGRYTVSYQAVSEDGHPVGGTFAFTVAGRASPSAGTPGTAPPAAGSAATAPPATTSPGITTSPSTEAAPAPAPAGFTATAAAAGADDGDGGGSGWIVVVVVAAVVVLAGGGLLVILRRRQPGAR